MSSDYKISKKKDLESELLLASYPKPNRRMLNLFPLRLSLYYRYKAKTEANPNRKGFLIWLGKRLGEKPVYIEQEKLTENLQSLRNRLFDKGFFITELDFEEKKAWRKPRMTIVNYKINLDKRYFIRNIILPPANNPLGLIVKEQENDSYLKKYKGFDAAKLKLEKDRLTRVFKSNGFYDYNPDIFSFEVDSFSQKHIVDIYAKIDVKDSTNLEKYYIRNIFIMPDYSPGQLTNKNVDTINTGNKVFVVAHTSNFKPSSLINQLKIESGKMYSISDYEITIKQFLELGVFKFVNIKYEKVGNHLLDCRIHLTPSPRMGFTYELEANNKINSSLSTNYLGTALTAGYRNKNLFRNAELLTTNAFFGTEFNLSDTTSLINTVDANAKVSIRFPYLFPMKNIKLPKRFNRPVTEVGLGTNFIKRIDSYTVNSSELSFGYEWKNGRGNRHLPSMFITLFNVVNTTADFNAILAENARLKKSFEEVFFSGFSYTFIHSNQAFTKKKYFRYFKSSVEFSSNIVNLIDGIVEPNKQFSLFGIKYSQYAKGDIDYRYYYNLSTRHILVNRIYCGLGVPYGNANVLPFAKQFFAGGTNDIRAFKIRGIGPGSYTSDSEVDSWDRTGDIKILLNSELRFPMFSYLKGALFVDAGNIWTIKENNLEGSDFKLNRFWKEFGIGGGLGLRVDFSYFVFRIDLGIPIRTPYQDAKGNYFTFINSDNYSLNWIRNNMRTNIGIGYPF